MKALRRFTVRAHLPERHDDVDNPQRLLVGTDRAGDTELDHAGLA